MDVNLRGTQYGILGGAKVSCGNCGQHLGNEGPSTGHTEGTREGGTGVLCRQRGHWRLWDRPGWAGGGSRRGMGALGWELVGALQLAHSSGE